MDRVTATLADYVTGLAYEDLSSAAVLEARLRLLDALGCAVGGYHSEPAMIARRIAATAGGTPAATLLGSGSSTSMEMAAFANTTAIRYLDFNDTYISVGAGHPSDMLGAVLAVAEATRASGRDLLLAMTIAYEIFCELADLVSIRDRGWDQGIFVVLGSAAACAKLLRLNREQTADAIAIAVTASVPTRQTRSGELAMWKGVATAAAARAGVFAAVLAQNGMTGPTAAFEGRHGLWEQVTGPFTLRPMGGKGRPYGVERAAIKYFPSEYHSQAPMWMALKLREKAAFADVESIRVETYYTAWSEIGSEPEKWAPRTRETADHSLPYLIASALRDGEITAATFDEARFTDPAMLDFLKRIGITESKAFTAEFPGKMVTQIELTTKSGARHTERASYPRGHAMNPMNEAEVESKFRLLCRGVVNEAATEGLVQSVRGVADAPDTAGLLAAVRVDKP